MYKKISLHRHSRKCSICAVLRLIGVFAVLCCGCFFLFVCFLTVKHTKHPLHHADLIYKKDLHDPDSYDGVIAHLVPDILE